MRHEALIGQTIDNQFEIVALLGRGGHGVVYEARQRDFERTVALKFFEQPASQNDESFERFRQEGRILSTIKHPNIMRCYMLGLYQNKIPYLVCEFVSGETLRQILIREKRLDWQEAVTIVAKICEALAFAESVGVVHRDLKPENIMLGFDRKIEGLKILDFGMAKVTADPNQLIETESGVIVGTPAYISPEQCQGLPANARSDIYSLGVILFELLDGTPPFEDRSVHLLLRKHLTELPKQPVGNELLPDPLLSIVSKALAKKPDDRFQSAAEMLAAIKNMLAGETILVPAPEWRASEIKTQWTASQLLLTAGILVPISFMSWLLIADPGPTKVILEAVSHGGQHSQELLDLAAWLKNAKKPQAAFCALKAASGYPHIATMAQLAILARAVEDASGTDTSGTDTSMLALHGLQMAERLCTTCNSDADRVSLASSANTFASVVLANRLQGEFGRKPAPTAQTCVAIIQWWQHAAVTMPGLSDDESLSYVDLLYVAECASLKLKLPDAPGLLVRLMYSARKQPTLQRKVIETFLDSTTIFSNKEEWHRFLSATLQAPHQDMLFSLVYHALEANSPNLKVEPLLESIVLEQKTPRSAELLQPLTRACKRLSTNKRLELCKLILESRAEPSGGKGLSRVMKLSEAYYLASANKYVEEVECFQQLTRGVHRFVQEASDDELNNAVRWLFDGHYRLPSDVADDLCFGWNKRTSKNATAKSILLNTPVDHVRDPDKPLILSLRGLLLGYNNYYSAGAELLKKAEQSVTDESYGWVKMIVPWRQTQFEALGPDPTRMKHYAEKALKEAVVLKDKAKEGSIRALIVQADLLRDKSDFLNGKITFPALVSKTANIATSSQLAAVVLSALDTMLQTNSQAKAKKLSDESLYLADDKSVDAEMRIGILLRAAHLSSQNGSTESVQTKRTLLTRARELSSKNGFTRLEQECIDSLSHL